MDALDNIEIPDINEILNYRNYQSDESLSNEEISSSDIRKALGADEYQDYLDLQGDLRYLEAKRAACERVKKIEAEAKRMRDILVHRYLLGRTLEETGTHFAVTRERVRQIENEAIKRIRNKHELRRRLQDLIGELDAARARYSERMDLVW